jgi:hypothetical protein
MSKVDVNAPDLYQGLGFVAVPVLVGGCAHGAIRTRDTRFRRAVLYPLSYVGLAPVTSPAVLRLGASARLRDSLQGGAARGEAVDLGWFDCLTGA